LTRLAAHHASLETNHVRNALQNMGMKSSDTFNSEATDEAIDKFVVFWATYPGASSYPWREAVLTFIQNYEPKGDREALYEHLGGVKELLPPDSKMFLRAMAKWLTLEVHRARTRGSTAGDIFGGANAAVAGGGGGGARVRTGDRGGDRPKYCFVHGYQLSHTGEHCRSSTITPAQRLVITANRGVVDGVTASKARA